MSGEASSGLQVEELVREFDGMRVLNRINVRLEPGQVMGLVGPNGSGKSTLINVISGVYRPNAGRISFDGKSIGGLPAHRIAGLGVRRTFQVPRPFADMTVEENVNISWHHSKGERMSTESALEFVGLGQARREPASSLNVTQQKLLDLAKAIVVGPRLLMVDELAAGLSQSELEWVAGRLKQLAQRGMSMLIVEHLMGFLSQVTEQVVVMNAGKAIFNGLLEDALRDTEVRKVFLGE